MAGRKEVTADTLPLAVAGEGLREEAVCPGRSFPRDTAPTSPFQETHLFGLGQESSLARFRDQSVSTLPHTAGPFTLCVSAIHSGQNPTLTSLPCLHRQSVVSLPFTAISLLFSGISPSSQSPLCGRHLAKMK